MFIYEGCTFDKFAIEGDKTHDITKETVSPSLVLDNAALVLTVKSDVVNTFSFTFHVYSNEGPKMTIFTTIYIVDCPPTTITSTVWPLVLQVNKMVDLYQTI